METLYITQDRCRVHAAGGHLRLTRRGEAIGTYPLVGVKSVVVFDNVNLTPQALDLAVENGIDVLYMSKWGKLKARVLSAKGGSAVLKLAQHSAFMDYDRRLGIAKSIVAAKIDNSASVVRKYKYHDTTPDFDERLGEIEAFALKLEDAGAIDEIMGTEGVSAKSYWDCFGRLLKDRAFTRREYRPSPDYVNALLNLGYAFLANEITTCLVTKGFDLEVGFLHSIHYGRNSLTLDAMEEFRAPFVDAWVVAALNRRELKADQFHRVGADWRLTGEGFRKFCALFHERVPPWRDEFREQAGKLKDALLKGEAYEPYRE
jgi:CRISPR-associated protein Cas1